MRTVESSPLLRRIRKELDAHRIQEPVLRVSVAKDMTWEDSAREGQVRVRWLCWNILDGVRELTNPEFEVVGEEITAEVLQEELPQFFLGTRVVVDNDIDVS